MAERSLVVKIIGDEKDLIRSFRHSAQSAKGFQRQMAGVSSGLGKAFAAAGVGLGVGVIVSKAKEAIGAASDLGEEINKTSVLFGDSAARIQVWSKTAATALGLSERAALEASGNFAAMFETLKLGDSVSARMSKRLVGLGADLASFSNQDPGEMLDRLRSGLAGEAEPLRRFGILLSESRVKAEAYRTGLAKVGAALSEQQKVQARYTLILKDSVAAQGDFARTSEQQANQERINAALREQAAARLGSVLLPTYNDITRAVNRWLSSEENLAALQRGLESALRQATQVGRAFADMARTVAPILQKVSAALGGTERSVKLLLAAMAASKIVALSGAMTGLSAQALVATGRLSALRVALLRLGAIGVITLGVELVLHRKEIEQWGADVHRRVERFFGSNPAKLPLDPELRVERLQEIRREFADVFGPMSEQVRTLDRELGRVLNRLQRSRGVTRPDDRPGTRGPGGIAADNRLRDAAKKLADNQKAVAAAVEKAAAAAQTAAEKTRAAFDGLMDSLSLSLDRAETTRRFDDNLRVLSQQEAAIKKQISAEGRTTELERRLFDIQQERIDIRRQQSERLAQRRQALRGLRQGQQFEMLGLTSEGEQRVPGVDALRGRLATLREQLKGSTLDTDKTRSQLQRIAQVLSGEFGKVGRDVRAAILQMFKDISGAFDDKSVGKLTAHRIVDPDKLFDDLGLTPSQFRELHSRMISRSSGGGFRTTQGQGAFGFPTGNAGAVVWNVSGPMTVVANDPDAFMRELGKKGRRAVKSRGGRFGGNRGL